MILKLVLDWIAQRDGKNKKTRLYYFRKQREFRSNTNHQSEDKIMNKQEVMDLVEAKKAAAGQPYDEIKAAVESIEVGGNNEELLQQIADLSAQVASLQQVIAQIRAILGL